MHTRAEAGDFFGRFNFGNGAAVVLDFSGGECKVRLLLLDCCLNNFKGVLFFVFFCRG